jgi:hypothetical protein
VKRAEVLRRLREGWLDNAADEYSDRRVLSRLSEDSLLTIAKWLGIEVENDDPPPPQEWRACRGGPAILGSGKAEGVYAESGYAETSGDGWRITVEAPFRSGQEQARQFHFALTRAYNGRLRWRTGEPPGVGRYLARVLFQHGQAKSWSHFVATWDEGRWFHPEGASPRHFEWMEIPTDDGGPGAEQPSKERP